MSHRWMKFWPGDWKGDAALRMCGLAARGLWIECIAIMHDAEPYGHLVVNGRAPTNRQIASIVGTTPKEAEALMAELEEAGVFSRTEAGVVFSRRMVRDHARTLEGREAISKRWANKGGGEDPDRGPNGEPNTPPNRGPNRDPCSLDTEAEAETEISSLRSEIPPCSPPPKSRRRASQIAPDGQPTEADLAFARKEGIADPFAIVGPFVDHHRAKGSTMLDWAAAWRTWCRTEVKFRRSRPGGPMRSEQPSPMDLLRRMDEADASRGEPTFVTAERTH